MWLKRGVIILQLKKNCKSHFHIKLWGRNGHVAPTVLCYTHLQSLWRHTAWETRWEPSETPKTFYIWEVKHSLSLCGPDRLGGLFMIPLLQHHQHFSRTHLQLQRWSSWHPRFIRLKITTACERQQEGTGAQLPHVSRLIEYFLFKAIGGQRIAE